MLKTISLPRKLLLTFVVLAISLMLASTALAGALPPANWYVVAWVPETDRLHWINANGEQANIARPKLANEVDDLAQVQLYISPNGRTLVVIAPLTNGRWGLGFFDFASGQWGQTHQTQPDEVPVGRSDYTTTSTHFATVLRNEVSGDWRVLAFDVSTGSAVGVLSRTDAIIPDTVYDDTNWYPLIAAFTIDEGFGTPSLRLQQRSTSEEVITYIGGVPSFRWYPTPPPALANAPVVADTLGRSPLPGIDVFKTTGQTLWGASGPQGAPPSPYIGNQILLQQGVDQQGIVLVQDDGYTLNDPMWLNGGDWYGYRIQNGVFQPHYAISTLEGGEGLPLGPNIGAINDVPDGFLGVDATEWRLYHATDLSFEGFSAVFGNTVFDTDSPFSVIYTTPEGATFTLDNLADSLTLGGLDVAAPDVGTIPDCPGAPAPRLTPGSTARVSFTNGAPLNLRNAPNGERVGQLPEGTVFAVMNTPPQCANGYLWWNIQLNDASTYWAAEGDAGGYFVEPYQDNFAGGQGVIVSLPTATSTLGLIIAVPAATNTPPLLALPPQECLNSPQSRLSVGAVAHVVGIDGTLAMYDTANAPIPTYQLPLQRTVNVIGGYACRDGVRMWQVTANLNGAQVTGWVAEGYGQTYYLQPGPGRALGS